MAAFSSYFYYRYPKALCRDRGALGRVPYSVSQYFVFRVYTYLRLGGEFRIPYSVSVYPYLYYFRTGHFTVVGRSSSTRATGLTQSGQPYSLRVTRSGDPDHPPWSGGCGVPRDWIRACMHGRAFPLR